MRITSIRKNGKKLSDKQMKLLVISLQKAIQKRGFISLVSQVNGSSINISNGGCSFTIDVDKLGYNARINRFTIENCKAGFKKTHAPTWTQRENFNYVINDTLDKLKLTASIGSGTYIVRDKDMGRINEWEMPEPFDNGYGIQVPSVLEVVSIDKAENAVEWHGINAPFVAVG